MKLILEKDLEMVNVARADEVEASWAASAKASALSQVSRGLNANSPVWTWTKEKTLSVRSDSQSENGNKQTASGLKPSTVFPDQATESPNEKEFLDFVAKGGVDQIARNMKI